METDKQTDFYILPRDESERVMSLSPRPVWNCTEAASDADRNAKAHG